MVEEASTLNIEEGLRNEQWKVRIRGSMKEKAAILYGRGFLLVLVAFRLLNWLLINFATPIT
jgi:hypothetical protein